MTTPDAITDTELLRLMRSGDASAFQWLYRRHQGPLYRIAMLRSGSPDTAADIVQEVFMGLLTDSVKFDPLRGALGNFLFGVARNLILKHEAPRRLEATLAGGNDVDDGEGDEIEEGSDAAEPLRRILSAELAEQVRRAIGLLAPHYRDAVILFEMHELSYMEIAEMCQVDIGTVRSRLSRGRAALAKRLAAHRPDIVGATHLKAEV